MAEPVVGTDTEEPVSKAGSNEAGEYAKPTQIPMSPTVFNRWKSRVDKSKQKVDGYDQAWKDNVSQMAGKPLKVRPEYDEVVVNKDWSRVKSKQAQLFYQVPEIRLRARQEQFKLAAPVYQAALNFQLTKKIKLQHTMDEVLADVLNAAGIGISKIGYDAVFEKTMVPETDPGQIPPEMQAGMLASGALKMVEFNRPTYECYYWKRVSPKNFIFPTEFTGTNWDEAPWLGFRGYMPFEEAKRKFGLRDDFKGRTGPNPELLSQENDGQTNNEDYVEYCEIWYKAYLFDSKIKHPEHFRRLVIVNGKDDGPARHEDSQWQQWDDTTSKWLGLTKNPIRVLTLTTISDTSIPPSDTEAARPQVLELMRSRSQVLRQRERSQPLRWFDVNQVDDDVAEKLRRGIWQDMIPMNGPGDRAIGEIARANYPRENFDFDRIANQDLSETWSMGPNQIGTEAPGETTAAEVKTIQGNTNVRLEYDRAKVLNYVVDGAEGIGALMQMFHDRDEYVEVEGEDGAARIEPFNKSLARGDYAFEARPDSAQRVDIQQERAQKVNLYQMTRNDPNANGRYLLEDVFRTHNVDTTRGMAPPPQPKPETPNVSYRFSGEDLANPMVVAFLTKAGVQISAADIQAAQALIVSAITPPPQPVQPGMTAANPMGNPAQQPNPGPASQVQPMSKHALDGKTS